MKFGNLLLIGVVVGLLSSPVGAGGTVTLYSSLDEPFLRPIIRRFEAKTGVSVTLVTDTEATKSAALVERMIAEKARPRADVYWGNEPFHTINLAGQGMFQPFKPSAAEGIPARWRDPNDRYVCIGLRARVIGFCTRPGRSGSAHGDPISYRAVCNPHCHTCAIFTLAGRRLP